MAKREFLFQVWAEGFLCTSVEGRPAKAQLLGELLAPDFETACARLLGNDSIFDPKRLTQWGCRLYPSEAEARLSFG